MTAYMKMRNAGAALSNLAYNLAQMEYLDAAIRASLNDCRIAWDSAVRESLTCSARIKPWRERYADSLPMTEPMARDEETAELRAALEAANAQLAAVATTRAERWMPIETAPRDGTVVLLTSGPIGASWAGKYEAVFPSGYRPENPWRTMMINMHHLPRTGLSWLPTHWQPLPPPPTK